LKREEGRRREDIRRGKKGGECKELGDGKRRMEVSMVKKGHEGHSRERKRRDN